MGDGNWQLRDSQSSGGRFCLLASQGAAHTPEPGGQWAHTALALGTQMALVQGATTLRSHLSSCSSLLAIEKLQSGNPWYPAEYHYAMLMGPRAVMVFAKPQLESLISQVPWAGCQLVAAQC